MFAVGLKRSRLWEEKRIALLPDDIMRSIAYPEFLFVEQGYGEDHGIPDEAYQHAGCHVVTEEDASNCKVVVQPKFTDYDLDFIAHNQIFFGWFHLIEHSYQVQELGSRKSTVIEWERMFEEGTHVFWRNNWLTGEIGVREALNRYKRDVSETLVAILGRGNVATGAYLKLRNKGTEDENIDIYDKRNIKVFQALVHTYDIIVHCARAKGFCMDMDDVSNMKEGALLVHLGNNSIAAQYYAQSLDAPLFYINDGKNPVYCVNHIPAIEFKRATQYISSDVAPFIDQLIKGKPGKTLCDAVSMERGTYKKWVQNS